MIHNGDVSYADGDFGECPAVRLIGPPSKVGGGQGKGGSCIPVCRTRHNTAAVAGATANALLTHALLMLW